ncbi:hypothetical protein WR25_11779 isoform C [Diploscapter pachys]|nr:hypothetical protein WR25_11779 isoform C [Diploscapter pachys]
MKNENRQVLIVYGSQTGTAEELSGRLAKDFARYSKKAIIIDPEMLDMDEFAKINEVENTLVVFCMATYGEGDPPDNAALLCEFLRDEQPNFSGVWFTVFGLGNKTYEHFNETAKMVDKRMEELGAERIFPMGLGDDDANLEEDFMRWREAFLPKVTGQFGWELNTDAEGSRQYRLEWVEEGRPYFKGEFGRLTAYERPRAPFDVKNPYLSTVTENRELHGDESQRSCKHIEFDVSKARIRYDTGDHLGVYPTNDSALVEAIIQLLDFNPDNVFRLINVDEDATKRNPFPCPTTARMALTHYVDICAPVKSHVLRGISEYTSDEKEKAHLQLLSTASEEGLALYNTYIQKERRSIVDILKEHPSCKPDIDHLLELLPRLQARYYSIASSPNKQPDKIAVCAVVTEYDIGSRHIKGVCTNFLRDKPVESNVPIFVRKSQMRLPTRPNVPVIMIGPGTGFAPFRGFLQERQHFKELGKDVGAMHLYYGCRHPDHDYIYKDELEAFVDAGVLTHLECAFSRAQAEKVYVQNKLWQTKERIWDALVQGAHIYVCGDARNMARDVQNTLLRIIREVGGKSEDEAVNYFKELEKHKRYQADVWS